MWLHYLLLLFLLKLIKEIRFLFSRSLKKQTSLIAFYWMVLCYLSLTLCFMLIFILPRSFFMPCVPAIHFSGEPSIQFRPYFVFIATHNPILFFSSWTGQSKDHANITSFPSYIRSSFALPPYFLHFFRALRFSFICSSSTPKLSLFFHKSFP